MNISGSFSPISNLIKANSSFERNSRKNLVSFGDQCSNKRTEEPEEEDNKPTYKPYGEGNVEIRNGVPVQEVNTRYGSYFQHPDEEENY